MKIVVGQCVQKEYMKVMDETEKSTKEKLCHWRSNCFVYAEYSRIGIKCFKYGKYNG